MHSPSARGKGVCYTSVIACTVQFSTGPVGSYWDNNNECLEHLTLTGPKHLHILYKYIVSKFDAYNMNAHACTHTDLHTCARTHAHTHTHTHTHTPVAYQGNETEEKGF